MTWLMISGPLVSGGADQEAVRMASAGRPIYDALEDVPEIAK